MNGKRYSWPQFIAGVVIGTSAIALLLVSISNFYQSAFLLVLSAAFLIQAPESAGAAETTGFEQAGSRWRQLIRAGLPILLAVIAYMAVSYVWARALRHFPSPADIPLDVIAVVIFAVAWLMQVIAAYRNGRSRRLADLTGDAGVDSEER